MSNSASCWNVCFNMWAKIQLKYYRLNKWLIKRIMINYIYNQIYFLQEMWILLGWCLTVKNWWCHLSQHLSINATNYFMY